MSRLLRVAVVVGLAVWAWRHFLGAREPHERASLSFADGSALVLEPGSLEFERLAAITRATLA